MIKELILKDFENHENTRLKLDNGFNLICGLSDVGKSSIVRAVRLLAYNKFDPQSVRVGKTNCDITAITEKGSVRVVRGKSNTWYVTPNGEDTKVFDKIGKKPLPDACEILGLNVVHLGDTDIEVNIMEQLEGHFMMSEIGGKNAAGSVRAQIVDEISGLTGIEGLIRDVAKDNLHSQKAVKSLEKSIEDNTEQLEDEKLMEEYEEKLFVLEEAIEDYNEIIKLQTSIHTCQIEYEEVVQKLNNSSQELNKFPNTGLITVILKEMDNYLSYIHIGEEILASYQSETTKIDNTANELANLGNTSNANALIQGIENKIKKLDLGLDIYGDYDNICESIDDCNAQINYHSEVNIDISGITDNLTKIGLINDLLSQAVNNSNELDVLVTKHGKIDKELIELKKEEKEIMSLVKVCPLTLNPIGKGCGI